jgi:hypothetical protein
MNTPARIRRGSNADPVFSMFPNHLDYWPLAEFAVTFAGDDERSRDRIIRGVADKAAELAGPDPDPLTREAAVEVALALAEARAWQAGDHIDARGGRDTNQALATIRRRDSLHRRLQAAMKTLAVVKRLARNVPAVAVQVVNVDNRGHADARAITLGNSHE